MAAVIQIAEASSGTPGRKNVIWVGVNAPGVSVVGADPDVKKGLDRLTRNLTQTLLDDRITMYYINPTINDSATVGVMVPGDAPTQTPSSTPIPSAPSVNFNEFGPATGGSILYSNNDINKEIATSINDGGTYYTLSYSPSNNNADPAKYRNITVTAQRSRPDRHHAHRLLSRMLQRQQQRQRSHTLRRPARQAAGA